MTADVKWGVVIVNYNSAKFALDAALSVLGDTPTADVVIVDNCSTNNSMEIFETAVRSKVHHQQLFNNPVAGVDSVAANMQDVEVALVSPEDGPSNLPSLSIVAAEENGGFAAGCNIGLRLLEKMSDCTHYLMLNPDAVVSKGAIEAFEKALSPDDAGLCGGTVLLANDPGRVQAFGGAKLDAWTLMGSNLGAHEFLFAAPSKAEVEAQITYPLGAAIALKADYLQKAGYMDERYFLYYEEADWAFAGRKYGRPVWARDAIVFHHYGVSSNSEFASGQQPSERSPLADYHMVRSRLLFSLKWCKWLAPLMLMFGMAQAMRRILRGKVKSAIAVARGSLPFAARSYQP